MHRLQFLFAFILLINPCVLIGGTLPLFILLLNPDLSLLGKNSGTIYSINNLGAAIGCLVGGFFLLHRLGMTHTLYLGGAINIFNGVIAGLLLLILPGKSGWIQSYQPESPPNYQTDKPINKQTINLLLVVFTLEGFTTLCYEVICRGY